MSMYKKKQLFLLFFIFQAAYSTQCMLAMMDEESEEASSQALTSYNPSLKKSQRACAITLNPGEAISKNLLSEEARMMLPSNTDISCGGKPYSKEEQKQIKEALLGLHIRCASTQEKIGGRLTTNYTATIAMDALTQTIFETNRDACIKHTLASTKPLDKEALAQLYHANRKPLDLLSKENQSRIKRSFPYLMGAWCILATATNGYTWQLGKIAIQNVFAIFKSYKKS